MAKAIAIAKTTVIWWEMAGVPVCWTVGAIAEESGRAERKESILERKEFGGRTWQGAAYKARTYQDANPVARPAEYADKDVYLLWSTLD